MKYTKKYPIHPKPKKQFSGASIFAQGGQLPGDDKTKTKTYTNKAEYDKALRAYNDSLNLFEDRTVGGLKRLHNELKEGEQIPKEKIVPFNQYLGGTSYLDDRIKPVGFHKDEIEASDGYYSWHTPLYKKPVVKPEYKQGQSTSTNSGFTNSPTPYGERLVEIPEGKKESDYSIQTYINPVSGNNDWTYVPYVKGTLEQEVRPTMAKGEMYSEPKPITELMMPDGTKWSKEKFVGKYGEPQWMKATGQKFANGGKLPGDDKTKTYTNKAEYDKALQAYNDSLINYKVYNSNKSLNEKTINTVGDMDLHSLFPKKENRDILPTALMRTGTDPNFAYYNKYKKPVFIPEYKEPTMTKGTMESEPKPINELMMPSGSYMQKDDFIKRYGEKPWLKATGQKFAFGGFKYPNGGSFYDSSNLDTSKPQLNKDGTTTTTPNSTGGYSPNYGGYAAAAVGAIPSVVNTWNNPNLTTTGKMQDTSTTVGRTAATTTFPVLGAAFGVQDMGTQIAADNSGGKYVTNKDTGKQEAVLDTKDQIGTNMLTDTGSTTGKNWSNIVTGKGTSQDWWSAIMGTILPGTEYIVNNAYAVKNEGSANQEQYNAEQAAKTNYLKNQKSQNFSAFGGYKNKFPYGGHVNEFNLAQMAYGGNMKSEVTGKSYLKDQVSDFTSNTFNKHETGGVAVDSQNEVEAGEIVYKDYVFSDRLKDAKGNSFAARAKKLIDQIK